MPDPPSSADLKARIVADIKRQGFSLIRYEELRAGWPDQFGTAMQLGVISMIAKEESWSFEFLPGGVRFAPLAK
jgi:hypothetical protein